MRSFGRRAYVEYENLKLQTLMFKFYANLLQRKVLVKI